MIGVQPVELIAPIPPAECAARLRAAIDLERFPLFCFEWLWASKPTLGLVTDSGFRIRKRIWYGNAFQRFLTAAIRAEGNGTAISGRLAMHPFVQVFAVVWFAGVILIGGAIF